MSFQSIQSIRQFYQKLFTCTVISYFFIAGSHAQVLSGIDHKDLNKAVGKALTVVYDNGKKTEPLPIVFTMPFSRHMALSEIQSKTPFENKDPSVLFFDYVHPSTEDSDLKTGLKLILVDGEKGQKDKKDLFSVKKELSKELVENGVLKTGDIILSFRNEWSGTGAYAQVQLGISHSAVVYVDQEGYAHNIDMPLDEHYIQDALKEKEMSYVTSSHYAEKDLVKKSQLAAALLHIVRPIGLTEDQKKNLEDWGEKTIQDARAGKLYKKRIFFNGNYQSPAYQNFSGDLFQQIFDLARVIQGDKASAQYPGGLFSMYCSEFAWSLLSLKDCSINENFDQYSNKPSCISPIFQPLPAVGDYLLDTTQKDSIAGLTDGPMMILNEIGSRVQTIESDLDQIFIQRAPIENMSEGHRGVSKSIPPELLMILRMHYKISYFENMEKKPDTTAEDLVIIQSEKAALLNQVNMAFSLLPEEKKYKIRMMLGLPEGAPIEVKHASDIALISNAMNTIRNYSPTSFFIHALLPEGHVQKKFDYVGTLAVLNNSGAKAILK